MRDTNNSNDNFEWSYFFEGILKLKQQQYNKKIIFIYVVKPDSELTSGVIVYVGL